MTPIEEKLANLPVSPGVYIMKGKDGEVLYIGKAKSLKSRVRSYFQKTGDTRYAVRFLASRVEEIDFIVTTTEKEALLLEDILLKQHKPRYNIRLKDSKTYVSIKITVKEKFPRVFVTRQIKKDGSRYFGPYVSARAVRDTIKFIRRIFPLCTCSLNVFRNRVRPCLDYQMGLCSAPAVGLITEEGYRELVDSAIMFLEGKNRELIKTLKAKMDEAVKRLDFEKAAGLRDRINAIGEMLEEQKVITHRAVDQDVFAFLRQDGSITVQGLFIRDGRLVNSGDFHFEDSGLPDEEVLSSFITEYYRGERFVPDEVILPARLEDISVIEEWLSDKRGKRVSVTAPERGGKLKLLKMAESNAREAVKRRAEARAAKADITGELQKRLHLKNPPHSIEAFDISNIGGEQAVGAMVKFREAAPDKNSYRLYRIKGVEGPDDYAMMHEVLSRRYYRPEGAQGEGGVKPSLPLPDLILIDGGKGQLNIAVEVLKELGIKEVEIAALAKERPGDVFNKIQAKGERVFLPNVKDPVILKEGSRPDLFLRSIRDEVHRFAISYHRRLRSKELVSVLERVPGIGAKKKKALFERFGDLETIKNAGIDELIKAPGITRDLAVAIKEGLKYYKKDE